MVASSLAVIVCEIGVIVCEMGVIVCEMLLLHNIKNARNGFSSKEDLFRAFFVSRVIKTGLDFQAVQSDL